MTEDLSIQSILPQKERISCIAFSRGGKLLAIASETVIALYHSQGSGWVPLTSVSSDCPINSLAFEPSDEGFIGAGTCACLWKRRKFEADKEIWMRTWCADCEAAIHHVSFSADGRYFLTLSKNQRMAKVWFREGSGDHEFVYLFHPRAIVAAHWRPHSVGSRHDSGRPTRASLLTTCRDHTIRIWSENGIDEPVGFSVSVVLGNVVGVAVCWAQPELRVGVVPPPANPADNIGHDMVRIAAAVLHQPEFDNSGRQPAVAISHNKNDSDIICAWSSDGYLRAWRIEGLATMPRRTPTINAIAKIDSKPAQVASFRRLVAYVDHTGSSLRLIGIADGVLHSLTSGIANDSSAVVYPLARLTGHSAPIVNIAVANDVVVSCDSDGSVVMNRLTEANEFIRSGVAPLLWMQSASLDVTAVTLTNDSRVMFATTTAGVKCYSRMRELGLLSKSAMCDWSVKPILLHVYPGELFWEDPSNEDMASAHDLLGGPPVPVSDNALTCCLVLAIPVNGECLCAWKVTLDKTEITSSLVVHHTFTDPPHCAAPVVSKISPHHVAIGLADGTVKLLKLVPRGSSGVGGLSIRGRVEECSSWSAFESPLECVAWAHFGLLACATNQHVRIWGAQRTAPRFQMEAEFEVSSVPHLSWFDLGDGRQVLACADGDGVRIFNESSVTHFSCDNTRIDVVFRCTVSKPVSALAWGNDGTLVLAHGGSLETCIKWNESQSWIVEACRAHADRPDYHPLVLFEHLMAERSDVIKLILNGLRSATVPKPLSLQVLMDELSPAKTVTFENDAHALFDSTEPVYETDKEEEPDWLGDVLSDVSLPGLTHGEQGLLHAIASTAQEMNQPQHRGGVDECGLRFLMGHKLRSFVKRSGTAPRVVSLDISADYAWALHSETQDTLVQLCLPEKPVWTDVSSLGVPLWLKNIAAVRTLAERVAQNEYLKSKNPDDCCLLYMALGRKATLIGLYKVARNSKVSEFLGNDFSADRWREAAEKNAFTLLGKQKFSMSAAFFILADDLAAAIRVCLTHLKDTMFALILARLVDPDGDMFTDIINNHLLEHAVGDAWIESPLLWLLGRYFEAVDVFLPPLDGSKPGDNIMYGPDAVVIVKHMFNLPPLLALRKEYGILQDAAIGRRAAGALLRAGCALRALLVMGAVRDSVRKSDGVPPSDSLHESLDGGDVDLGRDAADVSGSETSSDSEEDWLAGYVASRPSVSAKAVIDDDEPNWLDGSSPIEEAVDDSKQDEHARARAAALRVQSTTAPCFDDASRERLVLAVLSQRITRLTDLSSYESLHEEIKLLCDRFSVPITNVYTSLIHVCHLRSNVVGEFLLLDNDAQRTELLLHLIARVIPIVAGVSTVNEPCAARLAQTARDLTCILMWCASVSDDTRVSAVCAIHTLLFMTAWHRGDSRTMQQLAAYPHDARDDVHQVCESLFDRGFFKEEDEKEHMSAESQAFLHDLLSALAATQMSAALGDYVKRSLPTSVLSDHSIISSLSDGVADVHTVCATVFPAVIGDWASRLCSRLSRVPRSLIEETFSLKGRDSAPNLTVNPFSRSPDHILWNYLMEQDEAMSAAVNIVFADYDLSLAGSAGFFGPPIKLYKDKDMVRSACVSSHIKGNRTLVIASMKELRLVNEGQFDAPAPPSTVSIDDMSDWSMAAGMPFVGMGLLDEDSEDEPTRLNLLASAKSQWRKNIGRVSSRGPVPTMPTSHHAELVSQFGVGDGAPIDLSQIVPLWVDDHPKQPLFAVAASSAVHLFHITNHLSLTSLTTHRGSPAIRVRFSASGEALAAVTGDGSLLLWRRTPSSQGLRWVLETWKTGVKRLYDVAFLNSDTLIATASKGSPTQRNVMFWDTLMPKSKILVASAVCHQEGAYVMDFAPHRSLLVTGGKGGEVSVFDVRNRVIVKNMQAGTHSIHALCIDPLERYFVTGSSNGDIAVWSLSTFEPLSSWTGAHQRQRVIGTTTQSASLVHSHGVTDIRIVDGSMYTVGADGRVMRREIVYKE